MLTPRITDAFAYAFSVQGQQTRKGTAVPYMAHLMGVTALVLHYGGTETEAIGALLHDAAEDGGGHPRLADIHTHFGPDVARIVDGCSDRFVTSLFNDYRHHGETLWTRFNKDAGKAGTVGYYRGLVTAYRANGHHPQVITDLDEHVTELETLCDTRGEWPPLG